MSKLFNHIKKNIVKYLVYFFVVIIAYGIIEYIFFAPYIENLSTIEKVEIENTIEKKIKENNEDLLKKNKKQDKKIENTKKTIVDLEEDMEEIKNSVKKSKEEADDKKKEILKGMPKLD